MTIDLPAFAVVGSRPIGPPMLCAAGSLDVVPDDDRGLAAIKHDGWRVLAAIAAGLVELRSREGHPITATPYINQAVAALAGPGTIFDGELVDRTRPRQLRRTKTILGSPEPHVPTETDPQLSYAIFDLLFLDGEDLRDLPLWRRLNLLAALFQQAREAGLDALASDSPQRAPILIDVQHRPSTAAFARAMVAAGEEGVVIKHRDSLYVHGSRTGGWWRHKPQETLDARCTGLARRGTRKSGPISSLCFELDSGITGQVSSGLSAHERDHIAAHAEEYVGRILELAHHGLEESGALRHPVYRGVRDPADKAPAPRPARPQRTIATATLEAGPGSGRGNQRNYSAMGEKKLRASIESLRAKKGEAYERCLERGSGDPDGDLAAALDAAAERGLAI